MKEVEWWVAKVYPRKNALPDGTRIDLWEHFDSEKAAHEYVRDDGPDTPFTVVKLTLETRPAKRRRAS